MGLIDDKTQTINNVALFEVLNTIPKGRATSSLDSVKSKSKNLLPFLIDLLAATCKDNAKNPKDKAKCEASRILMEILSEYFPKLIVIVKEGIIKAMKAGLACGTDFTMPNLAFKVGMNITNLDFNGLTKIDPFSEVGSTFFGKSPQKDFNFFLNNLIQVGGGATWKGIIDLHYNKTTQDIQFKLNPTFTSGGGTGPSSASGTGVGGGLKFDEFLKSYVDSIELVDRETFMRKLTDKLTGAAMAQLPNAIASLDKLVAIEMVDALQDKIQNSDPCKDDYQTGDDFFTFSNDEMAAIEERANQKYIGVTNLDMGCGIIPATVDAAAIKSIFEDIRTSPPSQIKTTMERSVNTLNDQLTRGVGDKDKKTAKLSLNAKIIEEIPKILTNIIMEPKIMVLYQLASKIVNGPLANESPLGVPSINPTVTTPSINVGNNFDFAKGASVFFEYVSREALAALLEVVFNQVKKEIIKLIQDQVKKIIKEKLKIRVKAISSVVTGVVDGLITTALVSAESAISEYTATKK